MSPPDSEPRKITVNCACGASITVGAQFAGRQGRCPKCGQTIDVPAPEAVAEAAPAPARRPTASPLTRSSRPPVPAAAAPARRPSEAPRGSRPPAAAPSPAPAPETGEEPAAPVAPAAGRRSVLRSKLAELEKPHRSVILRVLVFLVLAGGAGAGTFFGTRHFAESKIAPPRATEAAARAVIWPGGLIDKLHDLLQEKSKVPPQVPPVRATPEQLALEAAIGAELDTLRHENQEAVKRAEKAHAEMEKWQFGWYAAIGLAGLAAGLIGWKLSA